MDYSDFNFSHNAAVRAIIAMREACKQEVDSEPFDPRSSIPVAIKSWPSGVHTIDTALTGADGFYGMTSVAADPGTGKTTLAMRSGILAAASGKWQVVHGLAEDDYDGFGERFNRYMKHHPEDRGSIDRLHYLSIGRGQTPESLTADITMELDHTLDLPLLVIIDSINSVANLSGRPYLKALSDLGLWMMFARKISRGDVSFLCICETNKEGEAKGGAAGFWSDLYLTMKKAKDGDKIGRGGEYKGYVNFHIKKSRRTPGEGDLGWHYRDMDRLEFKSTHEMSGEQPLYVVGGED